MIECLLRNALPARPSTLLYTLLLHSTAPRNKHQANVGTSVVLIIVRRHDTALQFTVLSTLRCDIGESESACKPLGSIGCIIPEGPNESL